MYNYTRHLETAHRKELEAKEAKLKQFKWAIRCIVIAVLASILCGGGIFFWRKRSRKFRRHFKLIHQYIGQKKTELDISRQENSDLCTQLHTANEENAQLNTQLYTANEENILLHTQIEKNSKLIFGLNEQLKKKDADIKTLALLKDGTEQLVRLLETEIRKRDAVNAKGKAEDTQIVKLFAQMAEERTGLPATDNWTELFKVMDNHFPSFTLQIKSCRSIGKNEYQVCVLTKLGFRVSDIAYLTNNSSNGITNLRSRMMVKLFGEEGGAKDFDAKIASL